MGGEGGGRGLLSTHLTAVRNHSTTRRGGAQPHTAQPGLETKRGSNCLGNHPHLFQCGALFRPLPRIIVMTLEGCFCECVNLIVSLDLLPFLGRGCLVKCSMRLDPFDLFHVGPVRVSIGRQQNPCIHLAGCHRFAIDHKTGVTRRHLQSQRQACKLTCRAGLPQVSWDRPEAACNGFV